MKTRIIFILMILCSLSFAVENSANKKETNPTYIEARGFNKLSCYKHKAIRHCKENGECSLEVFPFRRSAIHFKLPKGSELIKGEKSEDFGVFTFQVLKDESLKITDIDRVSLIKFEETKENPEKSISVTCK